MTLKTNYCGFKFFGSTTIAIKGLLLKYHAFEKNQWLELSPQP